MSPKVMSCDLANLKCQFHRFWAVSRRLETQVGELSGKEHHKAWAERYRDHVDKIKGQMVPQVVSNLESSHIFFAPEMMSLHQLGNHLCNFHHHYPSLSIIIHHYPSLSHSIPVETAWNSHRLGVYKAFSKALTTPEPSRNAQPLARRSQHWRAKIDTSMPAEWWILASKMGVWK